MNDYTNIKRIQKISRRRFLKVTSATTVGTLVLPVAFKQTSVFAENQDTLKIGLIGCGGRGTGAAEDALNADNNTVLVAVADVFEDKVNNAVEQLKKSFPDRIKVDNDHKFVGFDAYKQLIGSGVDVVILATPPGFRPLHLRAAVENGKHVFCEKPMAVDAPGVRSVLESAEIARQKSLAIVAGFCWRYSPPERATFKKIHEGAIGEIRAIYATYNTGGLWVRPRQAGWTDMQWQLRNWYYFTWLSGDHLVEQAVHNVDKIAWAMQGRMPVKAIAHGGRQVRTAPEYGHIYDHFEVVYEYDTGAKAFLFCRQIDNCTNDNSDYILGSDGFCTISGFRNLHKITGKTEWSYDGPRGNMYQLEHNELFASIRSGKPINDGVWMAQSTMMAIMGRMSAYTGKAITWDEALNSQEDLFPKRLSWDEPMPVPPVALPGITKFI